MSSYSMDHKYVRFRHFFFLMLEANFEICLGLSLFFNKTIIPLALVEYEIVIANRLCTLLAI